MKLFVFLLCIAVAFAIPARDAAQAKTAKEFRPKIINDLRNLNELPEKWNFE